MKRNYLNVDVILTFQSNNSYGYRQEFFELNIPINRNEEDAISFLDKKLFKRIEAKCMQYGRKKTELWKISTASNWKLFEAVTGKPSLRSLGHNCKWYFNDDVNELDEWEQSLKQTFGFGTELEQL